MGEGCTHKHESLVIGVVSENKNKYIKCRELIDDFLKFV